RLHLRLLERKRRALETARDAAVRRVADAERELDRCGALRRHRRDQFRAEIKFESRTVETLTEHLAAAVASLAAAEQRFRGLDRDVIELVDASCENSRTRRRDGHALGIER